MTSETPTLVWFRRSLRLEDHLALNAASARGGPVIPLFIRGDDPAPASAGRWWLDHSLRSLGQALSLKKSRLIVRSGDADKVLSRLVIETGATAVFWDQSFEPEQRRMDERVRERLELLGVSCRIFNDSLLFDPQMILTKQGTPFKVFTPFWNHCLSLGEPRAPVKVPEALRRPVAWPRSEKFPVAGRSSCLKWAAKMQPFWEPGAVGASKSLKKFLREKIAGYPEGRDHPAADGTSRLSPYLHFGEISVRKVWQEVQRNKAEDRRPGSAKASEAFLRQILWREFAAGLLFHFPRTAEKPLRESFLKFKWRRDPRLLRIWQQGKTGYPIVDAGMRQLWAIGWMHNRVRMIVASFLVKDLLIHWKEGAAWFDKTLVDADLANNTFGWQWVAGCGADAAPYFRIFNPVLQGEKFDPQGAYVRRWVPELSKMPARFIHSPWRTPKAALAKAGVRLGQDYPLPVVDHDVARKRALFVYFRMGKVRGK